MATSIYNAMFTGSEALTLHSGTQCFLGGGTGKLLESGNIYRNASGVGLPPAALGADTVVDVYSLPANSFDGTGFRGLCISAGGNVTGSDNSTAKIIFNPSAAVIGSTVTGGTTVATTGVMSQASKGWFLSAQIFKYGAANSNTQMYQMTGAIVAGTHSGVGVAGTIAAVENAAILIAVTLNVTTTASDCTLWWWEILATN